MYCTDWVEISYKEYKRLYEKFYNKHSAEALSLYEYPVKKELDYSKIIPKGVGLLESIRLSEKLLDRDLPHDYYRYYKSNGKKFIIMGSEEGIDNYLKALTDYSNSLTNKK